MDAFRGITIDPEGAADLDDAIHVERDGDGWLVQVAIPDCRETVPAGGELDLAARQAGTTLYSSRGVRRHMLSPDAAETLSLTPESEKRVLLITIGLDADLVPSRPAILPGTFLSRGRLTYSDANRAIRDASNPLHATLTLANRLAGAVAAKRGLSGALGMRHLGNGLQTDEEGRLHRGTTHAAERIIHELMVLANTAVADLCAGEGVQILYRNHRALPTASREALLESVLLAERGLAPSDTLARRLDLVVGRARLGPTVEGHWGLNLPAYAWFTSPIRRYADLVNQRILSAWVHGRPHPVPDLAELAAHLNTVTDAARDATADWLKDRAAREAKSRIDSGAIANAGATAFTGMVKASHDGAEFPEALVDEALARLAKGDLTSKDIARLLAASPAIATRVVAGIAERLQESVAVANFVAQSNGTAQPTYEESTEGPSHRPSFTVRATVEAAGGSHSSPPVLAGSLKEARQRAVLLALASAYGAEAPSWADQSEAGKPTPLPKVHEPAPGTNPKNAVLEICQSRKWPMPRFEVVQEGPSHQPTFTAVAHVDIPGKPLSSSRATGASRKAAEMAACRDLLPRLRRA